MIDVNEPFIAESRVLFGHDATPCIVAAELAGRFIRLFSRTDRGVTFHDDPFTPFILVETPDILAGCPSAFTLSHLGGTGIYCHRATFRDWHDCLAARDFLVKTTGKTPSAPDAPYLFLNDPVHQHLLLTGKTLFKGLEFPTLRHLAIDIETYCAAGFEFSNPEREEDRIIAIAVADGEGYEEVLLGNTLDEREMIERLTTIIRAHDPDVVTGHNLFRFDLDYLRRRAARLGILLSWGRDGSVPKIHPSRFSVAERVVDYPRWDIYGRHVQDTYFLLLAYDVSSRELESYSLKSAARHFGLSSPDRVYLDGDDISRCFRENPDTLARYNLDDVRETLALARFLSYPLFLQARIFPFSYQNCLVRGTATRINSLFLREYLHRGVAIPRSSGAGEFAGGYTDVFATGLLGPILHCDVTSLYPSILLSYRLRPAGDDLDLFLPLLGQLREFRLQTKVLARSEMDPRRREYFMALQQAFKVLINSFYGYLGTTIHNFADQRLAAEVTRLGRQIIGSMLDWLRQHGARPVEVDTDGVYFIPPATVVTPEDETCLVQELSRILPVGIDVELDGRWKSMFSYKMKNYALLAYDGQITIKGSSLRSRGMERYLREFLRELIGLMLTNQEHDGERLLQDYLVRLREHRFPISWLAKTETLSESLDNYRRKVALHKRHPSAAYELALRSDRPFRAGDQISYYVTGHGDRITTYENCKPVSAYDPAHPDDNSAFYCTKLRQLATKFAEFITPMPTLFS